jgi:cation diffusion facilitator family transporter
MLYYVRVKMINQVKQQSQKVIILGFFGNIALAIFKFLAGIYGHSQTLVADSINHMGDILTDLALLFGVGFWTAPPDKDHPHGHRRIETFISIIIGLTISATAMYIAWHAVTTFSEKHNQPPKMIALVAALVCMVIKELLYRATYTTGKTHKSPAIIAKAIDHRADAIEGIPVSIAVALSIFVPGWVFIDHIGAFIVSVFIFIMSLRIIIPAFLELTDAGASAELEAKIKKICLMQKGVKSMHKLKTRRLGSLWSVDAHIQVNGNLTVRKGHAIAGCVKHALLDSGLDIIEVTIHTEPFIR